MAQANMQLIILTGLKVLKYSELHTNFRAVVGGLMVMVEQLFIRNQRNQEVQKVAGEP